eukprot:768672-Hanusia_phi.AAC.9
MRRPDVNLTGGRVTVGGSEPEDVPALHRRHERLEGELDPLYREGEEGQGRQSLPDVLERDSQLRVGEHVCALGAELQLELGLLGGDLQSGLDVGGRSPALVQHLRVKSEPVGKRQEDEAAGRDRVRRHHLNRHFPSASDDERAQGNRRVEVGGQYDSSCDSQALTDSQVVSRRGDNKLPRQPVMLRQADVGEVEVDWRLSSVEVKRQPGRGGPDVDGLPGG